jgi:glycine/serine hydroxymethyltransferase
MGPVEMKQIASLIARAIKDGADEKKANAIKAEVDQLCSAFPVYPVPAN